MKKQEYIEINVKFKKETFKEINEYVQYQNLRNDKAKRKGKPIDLSLEDFVTGCVNAYLSKLKNGEELAGLDDLGKPYRLKNNFKDYITNLGWKQKDLAEKTKIDAGNISIILSNRSQPSLDYFLRIWIAIGCPPMNKVLYREDE
jgi:DNA-binding Xre family transcriptional regulator